MYKQLTLTQRYIISTMRQNGFSMQAIVDEIYRIESEEVTLKGEPLPKKRGVSTISRELRRNRTKTGRYNPRLANNMTMERRERIVRNTSLQPGVLAKAMKLLKKHWSPEQISGRLRRKN